MRFNYLCYSDSSKNKSVHNSKVRILNNFHTLKFLNTIFNGNRTTEGGNSVKFIQSTRQSPINIVRQYLPLLLSHLLGRGRGGPPSCSVLPLVLPAWYFLGKGGGDNELFIKLRHSKKKNVFHVNKFHCLINYPD